MTLSGKFAIANNKICSQLALPGTSFTFTYLLFVFQPSKQVFGVDVKLLARLIQIFTVLLVEGKHPKFVLASIALTFVSETFGISQKTRRAAALSHDRID